VRAGNRADSFDVRADVDLFHTVNPNSIGLDAIRRCRRPVRDSRMLRQLW
jgi:hypothetical protein